MRMDPEEGEWQSQSGDWSIVSRPNPSRSANAFRLAGRGFASFPALNLLDLPDWDNYTASVSIRPKEDSGSCGIVFDYSSHDTYNVLLLEPDENGNGSVSIVAQKGEFFDSLIKRDATIYPGEWYDVELRQSFGRLSVHICGHEVLSLNSPEITSGKFGLIVTENGFAEFDDLDVRSLTPSETASLMASTNSWYHVGSPTAQGSSIDFTTQQTSLSFLPLNLFEGSTVSGKVIWEAGSRAAIFTQGVSSSPSTVRIPAIASWSDTGEFINGTDNAKNGGESTFTVTVRKGHALIEVEGDCFIRETVELANGTLMFGVGGTKGVKIRELKVSSSNHSKLMLWVNEIFTHEDTMRNWNDDSLHWRTIRGGTVDGRGLSKLNERVFSRRMQATLSLSDKQADTDKFGVSVAMPFEPENYTSGPTLFARKSEEGLQLRFEIEGSEKWAKNLPASTRVSSIGLYRDGSFVLAMLNGTVRGTYIHPESLPMSRVAYWMDGVSIDSGQLEISSDSTYEYLFSRAPSEWKVGDVEIYAGS
ncbi:MAG: hypothetical protein U5N86_06885 [Planctomycetota bacterium]|nr:hypothetical protein [Planctomycetota bacterium]